MVTVLKLAKWIGPDADGIVAESEEPRSPVTIYLPEKGKAVSVQDAMLERGGKALTGALLGRIEELRAELT
ncbi:MAG: hypothetical protein KGR26_03715 [Cyanobacteria bacterium REEB65]|nr:hypothetical protein [Cyanobacteria bacterium REEB65]